MTEKRVTPTAQLYLNNVWTDISPYTAMSPSDSIRITRGRQDEASQVQASTCTLTLNNKDGRFTPRNPTGAYYGLIGRNTPLRVTVPGVTPSLLLTGSASSYAQTPDAAALDITGDIDIRAEVVFDQVNTKQAIVSKGAVATSDLAYSFFAFSSLDTQGLWRPSFEWSNDGAFHFGQQITPAGVLIPPAAPVALRVTIDVNDGAGHCVVTMYQGQVGTGLNGPWTQLGQVTDPSTTIFSSTAALRVGGTTAGGSALKGKVHAVQIRDGIAGTAVANPDFTAQAAGTTSFTDAAGRTWTVNSPATITAEPVTRFTGEVAAWPQSWNDTGADVWTPVQAAGILRRLGQGQPPNNPGATPFVRATGFMQCWPGATPNDISYFTRPLTFNNCAANVHLGAGDLGTSMPPGMLVDTTNPVAGVVYPASGYISGDIGSGAGGTFNAIGFAFKAPILSWMKLFLPAYGSTSPDGYVVLFDSNIQSITVTRIDYDPDVGYGLTTIAFTGPGHPIFTDGGVLHSFLWTVVDAGATTDHKLYLDGALIASGSDATVTSLKGMSRFLLTYDSTLPPNGTPVALSYITFWSDLYGSTLPDPTRWAQVINGYIGETAGRRIERLCSENSILFTGVGNLDDTALMGPQGTGDLISTLQEAANADLGVLYEPRDRVGLAYRTRTSIYNQPVDVTLDYSTGVLGTAPAVIDDDQGIHNDVTVTRISGGTAKDTLTTGPLSTLAPPNGIGLYATTATVNVVTDGLLQDQASWRLALSTVDETRWPSLQISMVNPAVTGNPGLLTGLLAVDLVDLLAVTHLPAWLPPDDVNLLAQGCTETLQVNAWNLTFNCTPASPYSVAVWSTDRYDAEGSVVYEAATSGATSLKVKTDIGQPWTTDPTMVPFDIIVGGERMTVTAVTGDGTAVFVAASAAVTGNNTSLNPTLPAGTQADDLVFILSTIRNTAALGVAPASWTFSGGNNFGLLYRRYDGVWTMPTCTYSGGAAGDDTLAQAVTFRRAQIPSPLILGGGPSRSNSSQQDIPFASETSAGGVNITTLLTAWKQDDWTSLTDPTGWTKIGEATSTAGNDAGQAIYYNTSPGALGSPGLIAVTGGAAAASIEMKTTVRGYQILTVTRSVNGVVKTHAVGETVRLFKTPKYGL